jgi:hypothetical protein
MKRTVQTGSFVLLLVFFATSAQANMGIPMMFITFPYMVLGLIPVVGLEAWVIARKVSWPGKKAVKVALIANVVSTVIGIPLFWLGLVFLQMMTGGGRSYGIDSLLQKFIAVTWQSPWLIPYDAELYWMVPAAALFLCIPFFFASWGFEYFIARKLERTADPLALKKACGWANAASYAIFLCLSAVWLIQALLTGR